MRIKFSIKKNPVPFFIVFLFMGIVWKTFTYDWMDVFLYFFYPFATIAVWIAVITGIIACLVIQFHKKKRKALIVSILCIGVLFLPLDHWYETARFWVLKDKMEAVSKEIAEEYLDTHFSAYPLPKEEKYLSRFGGEVTCSIADGTVCVSFYACKGLFEGSEEYTYQTDIKAPQLSNSSDHDFKYGAYYKYVVKRKVLTDRWTYYVIGLLEAP